MSRECELKARIEELEAEIERKMSAAAFILKERDALQADNARLREVLAKFRDNVLFNIGSASPYRQVAQDYFDYIKPLLVATPEQSLAMLRNQVREECVKVICCELFDSTLRRNLVQKIRSLKEPE